MTISSPPQNYTLKNIGGGGGCGRPTFRYEAKSLHFLECLPQDAAQNIGSSQCMTLMEKCGPTQEDLYMR